MYGNTLKKAIKKESSGNFKDALDTIFQFAENFKKYFAKIMLEAMKGLGTDDKTVSDQVLLCEQQKPDPNLKVVYSAALAFGHSSPAQVGLGCYKVMINGRQRIWFGSMLVFDSIMGSSWVFNFGVPISMWFY